MLLTLALQEYAIVLQLLEVPQHDQSIKESLGLWAVGEGLWQSGGRGVLSTGQNREPQEKSLHQKLCQNEPRLSL